MISNWKLATSHGILAWILIFVAISIIIFIPGIGGAWQNILQWVAMALIYGLLARYYFKKTDGHCQQSLLLAIYWLVVGAILDMIITIPLFIIPQGGTYGSFYGDGIMWTGFLIAVAAVLLAGTAKCASCCKKK